MARIVGVNLPSNKRVEIGLTYIFGIGRITSNEILKKAKINPDKRVNDLTTEEIETLRQIIDNRKTEGGLRREIYANIKRLKEIGCYRGSRHFKHLPVRGQRTKTNSRTIRGNVRKTMGSGHRQATQKT